MAADRATGERRASHRAPLALRVKVGAPGASRLEHYARDLSAEGTFLFSASPFPPGTRVELELVHEDLPHAILLAGIVVRSQLVRSVADGPGLSGMAIRFDSLGEADRDRLARLVQGVTEALSHADDGSD